VKKWRINFSPFADGGKTRGDKNTRKWWQIIFPRKEKHKNKGEEFQK